MNIALLLVYMRHKTYWNKNFNKVYLNKVFKTGPKQDAYFSSNRWVCAILGKV